MRQNPQITDGLLSQAVEGKVQELPYKTKEGITEVTRDTRPKHTRELAPSPPPSWETSPPTHSQPVGIRLSPPSVLAAAAQLCLPGGQRVLPTPGLSP